ncbi:Nucleoside diphosphate kinase [Borrelia nietonii YOR]|uniref:nucleoside-diphosphate kinase n=1 Tax=Borrelia nietonii YOR TaxID=1293576 RepID=A0ABM5PHR6_9SPIR|nr:MULTISPECIES: nucleoside-diphosphate kinase [Borrelia]AHH03456.1 Nucleoside diphosphate kinase [Borrelia nietonii YOR]AHH13965.1 Nucleoside diphosphate kinase [Borrelia hermsii MTW]UPA09168.1 nucleoside-diphosphate kinase [Borrelia nietonii YOR]
MSTLIQKTLCIIKPDGVRRGLIGNVISRFEKAGLKIVAAKMTLVNRAMAEIHYLYDDIAIRHGEFVWRSLIDFIISSPVFVFVIEGVEAVEVVRKFCGSTEPKMASLGTIRGDFAYHSFNYANEKKFAVYNVIHASASVDDALREIPIWFKEDEIFTYKRNDELEHYYG